MTEQRIENEKAALAQIPQSQSAAIQIGMTRAAQEVQAAMVIARRFPRDETAAYARIIKACHRKGLAESSLYSYPRGGATVSGPSIRMAEVLAREWGNIDTGVIELEQRHGESTVMAYAWDLETNTRSTKIFTVKHERYTKRGTERLTDPRDIYEMAANQGARRQRACILALVPGDIIEAAVGECEKTMAGDNKEPLGDRVRRMVAAFADFNVTPAMIEARLGHVLDATSEIELVGLRKIYTSLKDNMASVAQYFEPSASTPPPARGVAGMARALATPPAPEPEEPPADNGDTVSMTPEETAAIQQQEAAESKPAELFAPATSATGKRRGHAQ